MGTSVKIVLDTCALIWWSLDPDKLSQSAADACNQMEKDKNGLVPAIAIWEIAIKVKNNKLDLASTARRPRTVPAGSVSG